MIKNWIENFQKVADRRGNLAQNLRTSQSYIQMKKQSDDISEKHTITGGRQRLVKTTNIAKEYSNNSAAINWAESLQQLCNTIRLD